MYCCCLLMLSNLPPLMLQLLCRPRVYVSTPHPRASRFAAADRLQKDSEAQCTPDELNGIGDSFATPVNEAAVEVRDPT